MHLVGGFFALHLVAPQPFFRLRPAEAIRCQFSCAHVVEEVLTFLELLPLVDHLGGQQENLSPSHLQTDVLRPV
jgi:hypothetical protein